MVEGPEVPMKVGSWFRVDQRDMTATMALSHAVVARQTRTTARRTADPAVARHAPYSEKTQRTSSRPVDAVLGAPAHRIAAAVACATSEAGDPPVA
jgi:hypothetical protein